jgi:pimeloyl-ACP methyl ester carboxylesterase
MSVMVRQLWQGPRALLRHTPKPASPDLQTLIRRILADEDVAPVCPAPSDHVVFLRGVPVAPWIQLRPADVVWRLWLERLQELSRSWSREPSKSPTPAPGQDWESWRATNVHMLQEDKVTEGITQLSSLLAAHADEAGAAHLIGHSAGGAIALAYLAALREGHIGGPQLSVRSVITLDAAVEGVSGIWSGATRYLRRSGGQGWDGLHRWAAAQGITVLTVANKRDTWSHHALGNLPYLGLRLGPSLALFSQLDGAIHDMLRRMPQLVQVIWDGDSPGTPHAAPVPDLDTSDEDAPHGALSH